MQKSIRFHRKKRASSRFLKHKNLKAIPPIKGKSRSKSHSSKR